MQKNRVGLAFLLLSGLFFSAGALGAVACQPAAGEEQCFVFQWNAASQLCVRQPRPGVCCNEVCESNENYGNCAVDCRLSSFDVKVLSPDANAFILPGVGSPIVFRLESFGRAVLGARVTATGPTGNVDFFDEGAHDDNKKLDGVFGGALLLPNDFDENLVSLDLRVQYADPLVPFDKNTKVELPVRRHLGVEADFAPSVGRGMAVKGRVRITSGSRIFPEPLSAEWRINSMTIAQASAVVDSNATAVFSIPTATIDPLGTYELSIRGVDANNNRVEYSTPIVLFDPSPSFDIRVLGDVPASVQRLNALELAIELFSENADLEGRQVVLIDPVGNKTDFVVNSKRRYSINYPVALDLPLGPHVFTIEATAVSQNRPIVRRFDVRLDVVPADLRPDWIEPSQTEYTAGESVPVRLSAAYANGLNAEELSAILVVDSAQQPLAWSPAGLLEGTWASDEDASGAVMLLVQGLDKHGNTFSTRKSVHIRPQDPAIQWIHRNNTVLLVLAIIVLLALVVTLVVRRRGALLKRRDEIIGDQARLQQKYFEQNAISRAEYEAAMERSVKEQKELEQKLELGEK